MNLESINPRTVKLQEMVDIVNSNFDKLQHTPGGAYRYINLLRADGEKRSILVRRDGTLYCERAYNPTEQFIDSMIVEDESGSAWKITLSNNDQLVSARVQNVQTKDYYIQSKKPDGRIFRINVELTGEINTRVITDLVDDSVVSRESTWSSHKINSMLTNISRQVSSILTDVEKLSLRK